MHAGWKLHTHCMLGADDEGRAVKKLQAACMSCDRPLKMIRDDNTGSGLGNQAPGRLSPFTVRNATLSGPGWESGPKRAMANADAEQFQVLRCCICLGLGGCTAHISS
jgi:hypothetical protein